jgi:hypothetical protein
MCRLHGLKNTLKGVFFCCFFLGGIAGVNGQYFKPFTGFRVIQTEHFDIIYPRESEPTARTLAGFADKTYGQVSALLGISLQQRLPVAITPHSALFQGLTFFGPYIHIVLADAPMDLEWTAMTNWLEALFLHELTHAVSMSTMGPGGKGLHKIFGGWVLPSLYTAPFFMVEGAAVSFESLDGTGRVNDPLIRSRLAQDIHENRFHSPFQASGAYDLPPGGELGYDYGGLFSAYLQNQYGMEKYAQFWAALGQEYHISLAYTKHGYYHSFQKVYGLPLGDAWNNFKETLRLNGIEENHGRRYEGPGLRKKLLIGGTASGGGRVFFIDQLEGKVRAYDPASGRTKTVLSLDRTAYALDVSEDGGRLLVSSYRYAGDLPQARVTEYDLRKGRATGRVWHGLYRGRYFREGVLGLSASLHANNIVYRPPGGTEEVLLRGSAELVYSSLAALGDGWIAFTAAKRGRRELCLYSYGTGELYTLVSDLEDDQERWGFIRGLTVSGGRLLFSFDHDQRLYKLGLVDLGGAGGPRIPSGGVLPEGTEAVFSERDFSGGVFQPVIAGKGVYYRGALSGRDALMEYPEEVESLGGIRAPLRLEPWADGDAALALAARPVSPVEPVPGTEMPALAAKPYRSLKYMNPFRYWFPVPLVRTTNEDPGISFDGMGFFSVMADPLEQNRISVSVFGDWNERMAPLDLTWENYSFGFPLQFQISDDVDKLPVSGPRRITVFSAAASLSTGLGGERLRFSAVPGFALGLIAGEEGKGGSAYTWSYGEPLYQAVLNLGVSNLYRFTWELFGRGAGLNLYGRYALPDRVYRTEGLFRLALEPYLPLRAAFYGVWDPEGMDIHGASRYFNPLLFASYVSAEYRDTALQDLTWLAGAEAELKLFSAEIQRNISHQYYNRVYATLAWRGTFFDDGARPFAEGTALPGLPGGSFRLAQSLILRLGFVGTIVLLPSPLRTIFGLTGGWKISNMNDGRDNDFFWGPLLTVEF